MIDEHKQKLREGSVLCWLATAGRAMQPSVSPKEIFAILDERHIAIADIASGNSVRNIRENPRVCVSFVDIFVQKGAQLYGSAIVLAPGDPGFAQAAQPLEQMTGSAFPIRHIILVTVDDAKDILAPSYLLFPDSTTERSQIRSALARYRVRERLAEEGEEGTIV